CPPISGVTAIKPDARSGITSRISLHFINIFPLRFFSPLPISLPVVVLSERFLLAKDLGEPSDAVRPLHRNQRAFGSLFFHTNSLSCSRKVSYARNNNDFVADSLN